MAKESPPIDVIFNGNWSNYSKWFDDQISKYQTNTDPDAKDLTGSLLRWRRADGYAFYIVTKHKPLTVSCLKIGDGWEVEPALIRGLTVQDVREQLRSEKVLQEIFS